MRDFPSGSVVKTPNSNAGGTGLIPGRGSISHYAMRHGQKEKPSLKMSCAGSGAPKYPTAATIGKATTIAATITIR